MGPIGIPEMFAIVLIALLLFGPKKLPELGRMLGKGLTEFRRVKSEFSRTFETHMRELEREAKLSELQTTKTYPPAPDYSSSTYSYPYEDTHADGVRAIAPVPSEAVSTEVAAPYEPPVVSSAPVVGTVARSNGFSSSHDDVQGQNGQPEAPVHPVTEPAGANEEHRA